jgi:hypothetical protein
MHEDEKRLFNELIRTREEQNKNFKKAMQYILAVFVIFIVFSTATLITTVCVNKQVIENIEQKNAESLAHNQETIQELWRCYFETDYTYPTLDQNVDVKVGDD